MIDKWNVFWRTHFVGVLGYNEETKHISFDYKGKTDKAREYYEYLNGDKAETDQEWFKETLFFRVIPPNRVNIREILKELGMEKYDQWELLKRAKMVSCLDAMWMTKGSDPKEFFKLFPYAERIDGLDLDE